MSKAIVVTHGLFMSGKVMLFIEHHFKKLGYKVYNFSYKSTKFSPETILSFKQFVDKIPERNVYFTGHSLGGLLIRHYFENYKPKFKDTCIVTIATPHKGSSLGKTVSKSIFSNLIGSSGSSGMLHGLPEWNPKLTDLGCIVGTLNVGFNRLLSSAKDGDGTISIEESIAENAKDVCYFNLNHTAIIYSVDTINAVDYFIKNKKFNKL